MAINEEVITVNLNVNITKSERQLKKTEARLKKIQDLAAGIGKGTSLIDARSIKGGKDALKDFKATLEDLAKSSKNYATTTAGLDRQLGKLRATFRGISTDTKEFKNALVASEKVQRQLYKAQQETRAIRGRALTGGEAGGIVSELIAQKGQVYQSISALRAYRSELTRLKEAVRMNSSEFNELEKEIKRVDGILNKPKRKRPQDIKRNIGGITGREKALQEALRIQNETESSALGYRDAVLGVREAQKALNAELRQAARIQSQISQSTVSWGKAFSDLKKLGGGLAGGLANVGGKAGGVLKGIGTSRVGQIGSARIFSDLIKKVPVVDKAFGRLLQKIPLFGKLLNENTSVNARWAAQILEGITGITLAWNGLNQIISAAQAFTAFERQAAIAINSVARMFKNLYNVAGAMMMGLISPGQVGQNLWDQLNDRPEVLKARRGRSRIESLENQLPKYKEEFKNTELYEYDRIELKARQILEIEAGITDEQRSRILVMKRMQAEMGGPVWSQYGSPAGPGSKGAGWGSNAQDRLGDVQLRIGEAITANSLENRNAVSRLLIEERKVNVELARRKEILRVLHQGVENVNLSVQAQRDMFGISNREALESQKQQSPLYFNDPNANAARFRAGRRGAIQRKRQRAQILQEGLMLGAGFPVLFGGGPGAILGGAGGALWQGTRKKPERGFGGQILASAAGQVLDRVVAQTIASVTKLGQAFTSLGGSFDMMTERSLFSSDATRLQAKNLLEQGKRSEAAALMTKELTKALGSTAVEDLKRLGEKSKELSQKWGVLKTQMELLLVGPLTDMIEMLNKIVSRETAKNKLGSAIRESQRLGVGNSIDVATKDVIAQEVSKLGGIGKLERLLNVPGEQEMVGGFGGIDVNALDAESILKIVKGLEKYNESIKDFSTASKGIGLLPSADENNEVFQSVEKIIQAQEKLNAKTELEKEIANAINEEARIEAKLKLAILDIEGKITDEQRERLKNAIKAGEETAKVKVKWEDIKETIASGLTSAVEDLIAGTKTLGESLAGIAKSIANMYLKAAFMNLLPTNLKLAEGGYVSNGIKPFSSGGMVTRPTVGLVGEAGEDEYIIPASKMAASMQRYSAGARGEAVIPGTGSSYAGGGAGGSTTVDYSGPILNFNSEEFVPKSAVGEIIATATSRGARAGEARALSSLQNSRSRRSNIGL